MTPAPSTRRTDICEAALDLAAEGGNHALTHQAIDKRLGIAQGSTSYYFRSRQVLVMAAISHLSAVTRQNFTAAQDPDHQGTPTVEGAAGFVAEQLQDLLRSRRRDVLARYALLPDAAQDDDLRSALARCFFNAEVAATLLGALGAADPLSAGTDLVALLEGLLFDRTYGVRAGEELVDLTEVQEPISRWIQTLAGVA